MAGFLFSPQPPGLFFFLPMNFTRIFSLLSRAQVQLLNAPLSYAAQRRHALPPCLLGKATKRFPRAPASSSGAPGAALGPVAGGEAGAGAAGQGLPARRVGPQPLLRRRRGREGAEGSGTGPFCPPLGPCGVSACRVRGWCPAAPRGSRSGLGGRGSKGREGKGVSAERKGKRRGLKGVGLCCRSWGEAVAGEL